MFNIPVNIIKVKSRHCLEFVGPDIAFGLVGRLCELRRMLNSHPAEHLASSPSLESFSAPYY